jgi:hypothetical protein
MANDSSTAGYLLPDGSPTPVDGLTFEDFIQSLIVGITGLDGSKVVPMWQPEPPNYPGNVNWCSFNINNRVADYDSVQMENATTGHADYQRHEFFEVGCSFYGPNNDEKATAWRDGLLIAQNREGLQIAGIGYVGSSAINQVPFLYKNSWVRKIDVKIKFKRMISRSYPVLTFLETYFTIIRD